MDFEHPDVVEMNTAGHASIIDPAVQRLAASVKAWGAHRNESNQRRDKQVADLKAKLAYRLDNIVLTDQNATTGAVNCKATLVGHIDGLDDVKQDFTYMIEKTTSGELMATVWGL